MALSFWLLGSLIALAKPSEAMIRVGYVAAIATALQLAARSLDPVLANLSPSEFVFSRLLFLTSPLHVAFGFEFFYRFPAGPPPGQLWKPVRAALWCFAILVWAIRLPRVLAWAFGGPSLNDTWIWPLEETARVCIVAATGVVVWANHRRLKQPGQRRRLHWIMAGVGAATLPQILLGLLDFLGLGFPLDHPVTYVVELSAVLTPITLLYAILRHRTLGLQVILRQGVQYLIAKSALWVFITLPIAFLALNIAMHADQPLSQLIRHNLPATLLAGIAAIGLFRTEQLSRWLDQKFFREAHHWEVLLVRLAEELRYLDSLNPLRTLGE